MSERPDEETRKRLKEQAGRQQRREWEESLPLAPSQHEELLDHLAARLAERECDRTMRETRAWSEEKGLDPDRLEAGYVEMGAICDCEIRDNLDPELNVV